MQFIDGDIARLVIIGFSNNSAVRGIWAAIKANKTRNCVPFIGESSCPSEPEGEEKGESERRRSPRGGLAKADFRIELSLLEASASFSVLETNITFSLCASFRLNSTLPNHLHTLDDIKRTDSEKLEHLGGNVNAVSKGEIVVRTRIDNLIGVSVIRSF